MAGGLVLPVDPHSIHPSWLVVSNYPTPDLEAWQKLTLLSALRARWALWVSTTPSPSTTASLKFAVSLFCSSMPLEFLLYLSLVRYFLGFRSLSSLNEDRVNNEDRLDDVVESVKAQWLRGQEEVNLDRLDTMFGNFNLKDVLAANPSFALVLNQKKSKVRVELSRMLEMNAELSSEELKEYYHVICWNLKKRLSFFGRLNERLLLKARAPDPLKESLLKELESKKARVFNGKWIDKIEPQFWPSKQYKSQSRLSEDSKYESVGELLRFMRNLWNHLLEKLEEAKALKIFLGPGSAGRFYNYFDKRFPNLLMVSYGAASRVCREEEWFEEFRESDAL